MVRDDACRKVDWQFYGRPVRERLWNRVRAIDWLVDGGVVRIAQSCRTRPPDASSAVDPRSPARCDFSESIRLRGSASRRTKVAFSITCSTKQAEARSIRDRLPFAVDTNRSLGLRPDLGRLVS
jgi:hypothetical protein